MISEDPVQPSLVEPSFYLDIGGHARLNPGDLYGPLLTFNAHLEVRVGRFSQGFVFPSGVFRFQTFMCPASGTAGIESGGLPLAIIPPMSLRTQGRVVTGCPVPLTAVPSGASAVGKADRPGGCGLTTEESHEVGAEAAGLSMSFHTWVLYSSWVCLILDTG